MVCEAAGHVSMRVQRPKITNGVSPVGVSRSGMNSSAGAPSDITPWLGIWTGDGTSPPFKFEQEKFEALLSQQGFPWPFVKLVQQFATVRKMEVDEEGRFHFASKMLTGSFSWLYIDDPTVFSIMGYSIDTLMTWEDQAEIDGTPTLDGKTLVTTMVTTAAEGYFNAGWTKTTRITHSLNQQGEMVINVIAPEGSYLQWLAREVKT